MTGRRVRLIIRGRVQGVFYRASTRETAKKLGVVGWVRNLEDGSVEIVAEAGEGSLERFIDWCRTGPPDAGVSDVEVESESPSGLFSDFTIK